MHVIEAEQTTRAVTPPPTCTAVEDRGTALRTAAYLDQVIPLKGASHADVARYSVEIPMRYAECVATLRDGRKVRFADRRRFIGWSGGDSRRSLLFRKNLLHIELCTDRGLNGSAPGPGGIFDIILESAVRTVGAAGQADTSDQDRERRFIGTDGSLVTLPGRRMTRLSGMGTS